MSKRSIAVQLLLIMSLLLGGVGCTNSTELNDLSVVLAMGIDDKNGKYEISMQIVDPSQMSANRIAERSPTTVFSETCHTVFECFRKVTTKTSRKMYFSHLKMIIFDEKTAKLGIKQPLDMMFRDPEIRPSFQLAVIKNKKAKDVLELVTSTEVLPAQEMYKSLKVSERYWAQTSSVNVLQLLRAFEMQGMEAVITGMTLSGDSKKGKKLDNVKTPSTPASFNYEGIGMFIDDRLAGWLNEDESKAYTYITNRLNSTVADIKCPSSKKLFVAEVVRSKVSKKPLVIDGEPRMKLIANVEANVGEVECDIDLTKESEIRELEEHTGYELKEIMEQGIRKTQKYKSDIFGFGEEFHRFYPKRWSRWKERWNEMYAELPVDIEVQYSLKRVGKMISPITRTKNGEE